MGKLIQLKRPTVTPSERLAIDQDLALLDKYYADKTRIEKERKENNDKVLRSYRLKRS